MAKITEVTATAHVWNWLFPRVASFELPESLGEGKDFDEIQRAIVKTELADVVKELKSFSYYAQQLGAKNRVIFGQKEDWEESEAVPDEDAGEGKRRKKRPRWEHVKPEKNYTLKFTKDAVSGLTWFFMTLLSPPILIKRFMTNGKEMEIPSHEAAAPIQAESFCWPIIRQLKREKAVREALGLDKSDKKRAWKDDDEDEAPAAAAAKGEEVEI